MAQLTRRRTALALYSLLLVLPTLVLGGLHWFQLVHDHRVELAEVPAVAEAAARRLEDALRTRFDELLETENQRPFTVYRDFIYPEDLLGSEVAFLPSPLTKGRPPAGIECWFSYDLSQGEEEAYALFAGARTEGPDWEERAAELDQSIRELIAHDLRDGPQKRVTRYGSVHVSTVPLSLAVINFSREQDLSCLRTELPVLRRFDDEFVNVHRYDFHVRFYRELDGTPRVVATRILLVDPNELLYGMPECYANLAQGAVIHQGFFIDPEWLFEEVPRSLAQQLLRPPERYFQSRTLLMEADEDTVVETVYPTELLGLETYAQWDSEFSPFQVALSRSQIRTRHAQQYRGLGAVALMLLLSLATGMLLLLRSVHQELEQAQRTENFVAAVTHELRTPLAAIRLYGEMLHDGWATSAEKQHEYYGRIVGEVHRLESMVERVLEKSRVTSAAARPEPGDINAFVREVVEQQLAPNRDLQLELAPELPVALMTREGLRSIVVNLVENARKYAPVDPAGGEPILVRTRVLSGRPCLEVLDRGPGIPDKDKKRVFEAFYRRGDEKSRRARGTGLGLHLVKVQAQAMGGGAQVLDREGGGSIFRVHLEQPSES